MSGAMRCGASEPIRFWKLNCAREGTNLGGGWSRARDPRFPVQLHISAPSLADSESAQGALAPNYPERSRSAARPRSAGCSRVREPEPCRGVRSLRAGSARRGTSNTARRGSAPREVGCLNLRGAKRLELGSLGTARAGAEEPGPRTEPGAQRLPTPRSLGALTVAEAQRSQHEGQHDEDLGIHGTSRRRADGGRTQRG